MSEQKAEQTSVEPGSFSAGSAVSISSEAQREQASAQESAKVISVVESPGIAPDQEAPKADAPRVEASKAAPQAEAPKVDVHKADAQRSDRNWDSAGAGSEMESEPSQGLFGGRRLSALAAVVALAAMAGALGGALMTVSLSHLAAEAATSGGGAALEAAVARIDADILALKASAEHSSQVGVAQNNKISDRLDRVEKAQAEPLAKLAKLGEAVDKLRAPVAAAPAAAKEVTGSVSPPAATPVAAPKVEVARLPTVEGWVLRDIANGSALIESRRGMFEVYAGDPVPGLGRVEAIRRQDGRWVVVTTKGLIVAR